MGKKPRETQGEKGERKIESNEAEWMLFCFTSFGGGVSKYNLCVCVFVFL